MTPRQHLATAAYAFNSDTLDGLDSTAFGQLSASNAFTGANTFQASSGGSTDAFVARIRVLSSADLFVTKTDGQATAGTVSPVTYTIVVGNAGRRRTRAAGTVQPRPSRGRRGAGLPLLSHVGGDFRVRQYSAD